MVEDDVEARVAGFIDKFDPEIARVIREARAILRTRFPTACELIYDNYNFLVFGFSATRRASDAIVSLAAAANGVGLAFPYCGSRVPDPDGLLQGSGKLNRFLRVPSAALLTQPNVARLIDAAVTLGKTPLPTSGAGTTGIVSVSAKQRPRRGAAAATRR